jgi:hypothetical protein
MRSITPHTYLPMKMEQTVFQNVGIQDSDAGELPRRKHTTKLDKMDRGMRLAAVGRPNNINKLMFPLAKKTET